MGGVEVLGWTSGCGPVLWVLFFCSGMLKHGDLGAAGGLGWLAPKTSAGRHSAKGGTGREMDSDQACRIRSRADEMMSPQKARNE